jgi:NADH pyrophosphatase NudC (nudix superfamily)
MVNIEKALVKTTWKFSIQWPWKDMSPSNFKWMWFDKTVNDLGWAKTYEIFQLRLYLVNLMFVKTIDRSAYEEFHITQIKEKFGGLRFYYDGGNDKVFKLTSKAENKSYKICESCGKPGKPNGEGWIVTLCKKCRKEYDERHL